MVFALSLSLSHYYTAQLLIQKKSQRHVNLLSSNKELNGRFCSWIVHRHPLNCGLDVQKLVKALVAIRQRDFIFRLAFPEEVL